MPTSYSSVDLEKGVRGTLGLRMATERPVLVEKICEYVSSQAVDEKHAYFGDAPQMSEFKGTRKTQALIDASVLVTNLIYDAAVRFRRDDLRRGQTGLMNIGRQVTKLTNTVMSFPNKRLTELVVGGTSASVTNPVYDGGAYYRDDHPALGDEGGVQDNLLAGTGTGGSAIATDINTVIATFLKFKGTNGEPFFQDMNLQLLFMYHPNLDKAFREALSATIISNTSNVMAGIGEPLKNSRLTDETDWYAFVLNPGYRPLIWQTEQTLEVDMRAEGTDMWVEQREAEIGVSAGYGAGYGYWQSSIKVVNAG